jgi:hypothetical protein
MPLRRFLTRRLLRPVRVLKARGNIPFDPHSPEYLYLVQQSKRVSLLQSLSAVRSDNLRHWPLLFAAAIVKWIDLKLSNTLIQSLINEYKLLEITNRDRTGTRVD